MGNKVGIITVYGENNYGNKLQNYASLKIYESLNFDAETIRGFQSRLSENPKIYLKKCIKKFLSFIPKYEKYKYELIREKKFKKFSKYNLNISKKISLKKNNDNFFANYEYLSIGSDQVWNDSDFNKDDLRYFLASDAKKSKKIALSPSFGKNCLKKENEKIFINESKKFVALSCREKDGCEYIKKLTKKNCELLIDPTMYINKSDWEELEKKPEWLNEKDYIFAYFLGGYNNKLNKEYKMRIINIMDKKNISYTTSPEEFIYLIHHAKLILTDSFHACVFSIIFDKDFKIYERTKQNCVMTSRIESLFNLFNTKVYYGKKIESSKWKNKNDIIELEKKKMKKYLQAALK